MKASQILGIIVAIALIIFAVAYPVPEKEIDISSSYSAYDNTWADMEGAEYIGGDAYNYQIEASLKAGYMSGVLAMKSITFVGGVLLFFLTMYSRVKCICLMEQERMLSKLCEKEETQKLILEKMLGHINTYHNYTSENEIEQE